MTTTRARATDPVESHLAAATAARTAPTVRATVHRLLVEAGEPLTFDQLIARYRQAAMHGLAPARTTDQAIRTQCKYLEDEEEVLVVPDRVGRSRMGGRARLHCARSVYDAWLAVQEDGTAS